MSRRSAKLSRPKARFPTRANLASWSFSRRVELHAMRVRIYSAIRESYQLKDFVEPVVLRQLAQEHGDLRSLTLLDFAFALSEVENQMLSADLKLTRADER